MTEKIDIKHLSSESRGIWERLNHDFELEFHHKVILRTILEAFDRMIEDRKEMEKILARAPVGHLGLVDEGEPYVVPLNFVYSDGRIYFHTGLEGRKLDIIEKNPRVCFAANEMLEVVVNEEQTCFSTAYYRSVIAWGNVCLLDDEAEKMKALDLLKKKSLDLFFF